MNPVRSISGVVFDLDGVIIESEHLWEESWRAFCVGHGRGWAHADTLAVQGMSAPEWSAFVARHVGEPDTAAQVTDFCVGYLIDRIRAGDGRMIEGARDLLEGVAARVPVALATSAPRRAIDAVLEHHSLASLFTATVSSEEVARGKPSPDVYLEAISRLGVDPLHGLGIEDSSNGIRSAHAAGLLVVAIPNPTYPPHPDAAALADHIAVDHVDALQFILAQLDAAATSAQTEKETP
ncbi:MAG: HAD family phosphatase [Burkholderiaceae bacterium]|nr:HAD family phosphatase [Microbacteriaceae bacterium]